MIERFRAWDVEEKEMIFSDMLGLVPFWILYKHQGFIVMQYTGLKDKNGKEIYEGDVIRNSHGAEWYVGYDENELVWSLFYSSVPQLRITKSRLSEGKFVVIGNIHKNPELLNART